MSAASKLTSSAVPVGEATIHRAQAIAGAWQRLGDAVAPLSNGSGRPLARTVKLVLDPLVIRPVQNPHLATLSLTPDAAAELTARIEDARADLAATAAWFLILKRARRAQRITEGNPQEKYFQRCFELARTIGAPDAATAETIATATVVEIAAAGGDALLTRVRALLQDADSAARLQARLDTHWRDRAARATGPADPTNPDSAHALIAALEACGSAAVDLGPLVDAGAGSAASIALDVSGAARLLGLTAHEIPLAPPLGRTASKRDLPRPFDRSVFERLFSVLSGSSAADIDADAQDIVEDEIARSASAWELGEETSRVMLQLGVEASHALEPTALLRPTAAHRLLRGRWEREAYVRRALRLPVELSGVPAGVLADIRDVRQGYLRRLWVRLHGRELRMLETTGTDVWDTLDGVLRSVVLDQRHRLKLAIGRETAGAA